MNLLVFGPQALSLDEASFDTIHSDLPDWIIDQLDGLPAVLEAAVAAVGGSDLKKEALVATLAAFSSGNISFPLPNILLSPLVVATHLHQYTKYLKNRFPSLSDDETIPLQGKAVGLCTGSLSEAVLVSSPTLKDIRANGAKAITLAMLAGAMVDASDAASSVTVSWHASTQDVNQIVSQFPDVSNRLPALMSSEQETHHCY